MVGHGHCIEIASPQIAFVTIGTEIKHAECQHLDRRQFGGSLLCCNHLHDFSESRMRNYGIGREQIVARNGDEQGVGLEIEKTKSSGNSFVRVLGTY